MASRKSSSTVRYGFIGGGAIAQRRHLPEARLNRRAVVAAIADPVTERVEGLAREYGARAFTDYRRMIAEVELDAIVVAGPNALHAEMTLDSFKAGLHVLCEKPMATTLAEARAMIAAATKAKKKLMIAMNQRFMPQHVRAKKILDSGRLGRVLTFWSRFANPGPERWSVDGAASWFTRPELAGFGVMGDLAVHKIDLLRWLLGDEFTQVWASVASLGAHRVAGGRPSVEDNANLILRTRGGVQGTICASWTWYGRHDNQVVIGCEQGVLSVGTDPVDHLVVDYRDGDREAHRFAGTGDHGWPRHSGVIDAFTGCLLDGRPIPIDGEEGLRDMEVIVAALAAAESRTRVTIAQASPSGG